ncbi:hypothetical protein RISK_001601 [Rhodopirellula islandica]|uniref:Transmembrane protein n=1 Tax=Rhodopirellula islandica TaxID=595434 RepID=A0A0J1BIM9_RHOIS|nr:hypothetical protein RISK_001601 [Rhodopirellula islandica]
MNPRVSQCNQTKGNSLSQACSFWSFVAIVLFFVLGRTIIRASLFGNERLLTQSLVVSTTISCFLAVSVVGGYFGGLAAELE